MNILFVCRGNLQRSPTAEDMMKVRTGEEVNVRSAGINRTARTRIDKDLLNWADYIYVMTESIKKSIENEFPNLSEKRDINVFNIPDRYRRDEPRLKKRLLEEFSKDSLLSRYVEKEDLEEMKGKGEDSLFDRFP